jgi:hypothetical protein
LFCNWINEILHYAKLSILVNGKAVNFSSHSRVRQILTLLGYGVGAVSFTYLGCPIFKGKPKCSNFKFINKIKVKLATWKGVLLSIMGRVQLIKPIIHGMLVYSFHVYLWPVKLLCQLDQWIKNFLWSGDIFSRKVCTVSWQTIGLPFESRGLDMRSTMNL